MLRHPPVREEAVAYLFRKHTVYEDPIHRQSVQGEVDECPLRLAQYHPLGVGHQPDAGRQRVDNRSSMPSRRENSSATLAK